MAQAHALDLLTLVEVHHEREVEPALAAAPRAIGVNTRDLSTFELDPTLHQRLLPEIGDEVLRVAESGLRSAADLRRVEAAGADAVLLGEALMRSDDPQARVAHLLGEAAR